MLFDESILGIPLTINWRWVVKVVADIKIIKMTVTIFVVASLEPKNVKKGQDPKHHVGVIKAPNLSELIQIRLQVAVRQHRCLGRASRAAREQHDGQVIGLHVHNWCGLVLQQIANLALKIYIFHLLAVT